MALPAPPRWFPTRSRLRFWRTHLTGQFERGHEPLSIDRLVSPLRYDIAIRGDLLAWLAGELDAGDHSLDHYVEGARQRPYGAWFERIAIYRIGGRRGPDADVDQALRRRVHRSVELVRSYTAHGFDARFPITVHRCPPVLLHTGKRMGARYYPVDGCHRLALLRMSGATHLGPDQYLVDLKPREPRDNTAALLDLLTGDRADYYRFVGGGYGLASARTRGELVDHVAASDPARLIELESVLDADEAVLTTVGRGGS